MSFYGISMLTRRKIRHSPRNLGYGSRQSRLIRRLSVLGSRYGAILCFRQKRFKTRISPQCFQEPSPFSSSTRIWNFNPWSTASASKEIASSDLLVRARTRAKFLCRCFYNGREACFPNPFSTARLKTSSAGTASPRAERRRFPLPRLRNRYLSS